MSISQLRNAKVLAIFTFHMKKGFNMRHAKSIDLKIHVIYFISAYSNTFVIIWQPYFILLQMITWTATTRLCHLQCTCLGKANHKLILA